MDSPGSRRQNPTAKRAAGGAVENHAPEMPVHVCAADDHFFSRYRCCEVSLGSTTPDPKAKVLIVLTVVLAFVAAAALSVPRMSGDYTIFVSVAERVRAGDRLYVQVWDNKDPLFYYSLALARAVHPLGGYLLELMWLALAASAGYWLARWRGSGHVESWLVGALIAVLCTGGVAFAGYTHLPGTALSLAAIAAGLWWRPFLAGGALALVAFLKITSLPVALVGLLTIIVWRRSPTFAIRSVAGMAVLGSVILAVMAARGEVSPYFDMLWNNVSYAASGGTPSSHLYSVFRHQASAIAAIGLLALLAYQGASWRRSAEVDTALWIIAVLCGVAALGILALTGMWEHHAQVLYIAAALGLVRAIGPTSTARMLFSGLALALILGGFSIQKYERALKSATVAGELGWVPEVSSVALRTNGVATIARVGGNDDGWHATGLSSLHLQCPRFHQYPFDPDIVLRATSECLRSADAIIISERFGPRDVPTWNAYVDRVVGIANERECIQYEGGSLCLRRP